MATTSSQGLNTYYVPGVNSADAKAEQHTHVMTEINNADSPGFNHLFTVWLSTMAFLSIPQMHNWEIEMD